MNAAEHDRHRDDVGAYLLGALSEDEARAFEAHAAACHVCQDELRDLRLAAAALPRGVPQLEAPPHLKQRVMAEVEAEVGSVREPREGWWQRAAGLFGGRPRAAWAAAVVVIALAVAAGFGTAQLLGGDDGARTVVATVDERRLGDASARLTLEDDGREGGILRVAAAPVPRPGRTYQAWVARGDEVSPQPTFDVDAAGGAVIAIPADLSDADAVLLTREPEGGSREPTERPVMRIGL